MRPLAHDWVFTHTGQRRGGFDEVVFACRACEAPLRVMRASQFLPRTPGCTPGPSPEELSRATRSREGWRHSADCALEQARLVTSE